MTSIIQSIRISIFSFATLFLFQSCEQINLEPQGLTNGEIIEGLKRALVVSTDTSVSILNKVDGYYGDDLVKIWMPDEALIITQNITKIPGGQALLDETIKAINRSAEDAAKEAAPIFINVITSITIDDGTAILQGSDDAATQYLNNKTYDSLQHRFQPKINTSLSKELISGVSAQGSYASLVNKYNVVANASFGVLKPIVGNSLSEHTTTKALDGLFYKVAEEEGKIRNDINHRVDDILKKVFDK